MSQALVELLRQYYATQQMPTDALTPDVVLIQPDDVLGQGVFHGREAWVRAVRELTDTFDDFRIEPERFFDLGDNRVMVFVRFRGRAHASGVSIDEPVAHVWSFHGTQIARLHVYADWDEALEAVGLRE
jgi:ketosteroid isomerase-like protein